MGIYLSFFDQPLIGRSKLLVEIDEMLYVTCSMLNVGATSSHEPYSQSRLVGIPSYKKMNSL